MFKQIFYPLVEQAGVFNIFQYISFRAAYAAVCALLITFLFGPRMIQWLLKFKMGEEIKDDLPQRHLAKAGTPTMGGTLIIVATVITILLWQDLTHFYAWVILLTAVSFGLLGFMDDWLKIVRGNSKGLKMGLKFSGQVLISLAIMVIIYMRRGEETTLLYLPFLKDAVLDMGILYIPFGTLLIVGISNSVNLTDGLDGLATGLMIIVLLAFAVLTYLTGHVEFARYLFIPYLPGAGELSVSSLALLGACVGFLWFNCHPAEVMMGDTGSLTLGGLAGVIALLIKKEVLLIVIAGVFVIETFSVIIQVLHFKRTGRRVFKMAPLHHHFEIIGWAESKVVTRFWILGGMFAILGLSTLKIQ